MAFALQQRLLRMVACGIPSRADVEDLSTGDWAQALLILRQHRLAPLLHWRLGESGGAEHVPQAFAEAVAASFEKYAACAVQLQAEVARVQRILRENEIPAVFLRGAYLAFHVYPHAALRPVRGLDALVPESQAEDARHALKSSTLRRPGALPDKPPSRIRVELHTHLTEPGHWPAARRLDPAFNATTWNRLICSVVGQEEVWYLSPEDQLLHLVVHTLYGQQRRCGPLVLSDLAGLLGHATIDWPRFWRMAEAGRWAVGARLLLALTQHFYPSITFVTPDDLQLPPLPADLSAAAASLTLGRDEERVNAWRELKLQTRNDPFGFVRELLAG
jgi:hypothetical protein